MIERKWCGVVLQRAGLGSKDDEAQRDDLLPQSLRRSSTDLEGGSDSSVAMAWVV